MKPLNSLLLSLLISCQLTAQINVGVDSIILRAPDLIQIQTDTITLARNCAYQKYFEKADELLTEYNAIHSDINALGLQAQVLYWMQQYDRSIDLYEKAICLFPQPSSLYLDYARVLYNLGSPGKTGRLLKTYREFDSTNAEEQIMSAYLNLGNGKIALAGKQAGMLLQKYPGNAEAKDIISKINYYTTANLKLGTEILSDDQPLKGHAFYTEGGIYKSWLFAPTVQAALYQFRANDSSFHSSWTQIGNTIQIGTKNKIKLKGGIFQQNSNTSEFTGSAEASHQVTHNFLLQAGIERRPYQYTISSIKTAVMENASSISLSYNKNDKWYGKIAYELTHYKDGNKIQNAYLWILAPVISKTHFSISAGYAFGYADSRNSNFVSTVPLSQLIVSPPGNVPGIYDPYFTPENQHGHHAIASIKIIPTKKVQFTSRISIGFAAKADNPYVYLDKNGGEFFIHREFVQTDFTPATWVNELSIAASSKFFIAAAYTYDKLLYYTSHRGSIELKYLFLK